MFLGNYWFILHIQMLCWFLFLLCFYYFSTSSHTYCAFRDTWFGALHNYMWDLPTLLESSGTVLCLTQLASFVYFIDFIFFLLSLVFALVLWIYTDVLTLGFWCLAWLFYFWWWVIFLSIYNYFFNCVPQILMYRPFVPIWF